MIDYQYGKKWRNFYTFQFINIKILINRQLYQLFILNKLKY